jgi:hypothetical protein
MPVRGRLLSHAPAYRAQEYQGMTEYQVLLYCTFSTIVLQFQRRYSRTCDMRTRLVLYRFLSYMTDRLENPYTLVGSLRKQKIDRSSNFFSAQHSTDISYTAYYNMGLGTSLQSLVDPLWIAETRTRRLTIDAVSSPGSIQLSPIRRLNK